MHTPTPPELPAFSVLPPPPPPPDHAALFHPDGGLNLHAQIVEQLSKNPGFNRLLDQCRDSLETQAMHDRNAAIAREEERLNLYLQQGDVLRQMHLRRRQEQHCELCGHRFNYKAQGGLKHEEAQGGLKHEEAQGELKHENDWCRPDKRYCDSKGNLSCWDLQNAQKAANRRKRRKARKTTTTTTEPVDIALHSNDATPPH